MMNLVIVCALFQWLLSSKLSWLRRIITPVISGMVLMLIAVAVMPVAFDMLTHAPESAAPGVAPGIAAVTLVVLVALVFGARGALRLWAPVIALARRFRGCRVFRPLRRRLDTGSVLVQHSLRQPAAGSACPWALISGYFCRHSCSSPWLTPWGISTPGSVVQRASMRTLHSVDFRAVQEGLAANSLGNLVAGLPAPCR